MFAIYIIELGADIVGNGSVDTVDHGRRGWLDAKNLAERANRCQPWSTVSTVSRLMNCSIIINSEHHEEKSTRIRLIDIMTSDIHCWFSFLSKNIEV